jgi:hypothetical protein
MSYFSFCIVYVRAYYAAPIVGGYVSSVVIVSDISGFCSLLICCAASDFSWLVFAPDNSGHDDAERCNVSDYDDQFVFHCLSLWIGGATPTMPPLLGLVNHKAGGVVPRFAFGV